MSYLFIYINSFAVSAGFSFDSQLRSVEELMTVRTVVIRKGGRDCEFTLFWTTITEVVGGMPPARRLVVGL
jgi:hypothetical protein